MTDLKTYTTIQINEAFWKRVAPIALDLLCFLVIYFSPQIKRGLTTGGIKTIEAVSDFLKRKFPKLYAKILENKKLAEFLSSYPDIITDFIEFVTNNELTTKAMNMFVKKVILRLPEDKIEEIKSLLE